MTSSVKPNTRRFVRSTFCHIFWSKTIIHWAHWKNFCAIFGRVIVTGLFRRQLYTIKRVWIMIHRWSQSFEHFSWNESVSSEICRGRVARFPPAFYLFLSTRSTGKMCLSPWTFYFFEWSSRLNPSVQEGGEKHGDFSIVSSLRVNGRVGCFIFNRLTRE